MRPLKEKNQYNDRQRCLEKIKAEAENDDRSLSQFINIVLKEHLKKEK